MAAKEVVENCLTISIFDLWQKGFFKSRGRWADITWGHAYEDITNSLRLYNEGDHVRISYTFSERNGSNPEPMDYLIRVVYTCCHFGGSRPWFICPGVKNGDYCGRRVAKLYMPPNCRYFLCRHCYDLSYMSRREESPKRYRVRMARLLGGLGRKKGKWSKGW